MATVNFQCGHCGKLMAVEAGHLGHQVRCPHCQGVVLTPPAATAEPPATEQAASSDPPPLSSEQAGIPDWVQSSIGLTEMSGSSAEPSIGETFQSAGEVSTPAEPPRLGEPPSPFEATPPSGVPAILEGPTPVAAEGSGEMTFNIPQATDQDSIFSETEPASDDLFGEPISHVEMPPEPAIPQLSLESPMAPAAPGLSSEMEPPGTASFEIPVPPPETPTNGQSGAGLGSGTIWAQASAPTAAETSASSLLAPPVVRMPKQRGWLLPLVIIPLISYSALATVLLVKYYFDIQRLKENSPLEYLPDQGDGKGATHGKGASSRIPQPDQELPAKLRVALNQTIRIGDLEVTPLRVHRRAIQFRSEGQQPDPTRQEALALELRLHNVSDDVYFKPLDAYFVRSWKEAKPFGAMPYSFLTMGKQRFFGGPIDYNRKPRLLVVGQEQDKMLGPGEVMTTFICTDPEDKAVETLRRMKDTGPFLWRVQVRRGLVKVNDHEVSASAVVGVEFSRSDVQ